MILDRELLLACLRTLIGLIVLKELFRLVRFRRSMWIGFYDRPRVRDTLLTILGVVAVFFTAGLFVVPAICVFSVAYYFLSRATCHKKFPKTGVENLAYRVVVVTFSGKLLAGFEPFRNQFEKRTKGADADLFPEFARFAREIFLTAEKKLKESKEDSLGTDQLRFLFAFAEDVAELCKMRLKQPAAKLIFQIMTPSSQAKETYYHGFSSGEGWRDAFQIEFTGMRAVRLNGVQRLTGF